jgi:hypothetical protein
MDLCATLRAACGELGLRCRCEITHLEPCFTIAAEQADDGPVLNVRLRRDPELGVRLVARCAEAPGLLLEITEETVQREPVMHLWLPHRRRHLILVHRRDGAWSAASLPAASVAQTVAAALADLADLAPGP